MSMFGKFQGTTTQPHTKRNDTDAIQNTCVHMYEDDYFSFSFSIGWMSGLLDYNEDVSKNRSPSP